MNSTPPTSERRERRTARRHLTAGRLTSSLLRVNVGADGFRRSVEAAARRAGIDLESPVVAAAVNTATRAEIRAQVCERRLRQVLDAGPGVPEEAVGLLDRVAAATADRDRALGRIGFPAGSATGSAADPYAAAFSGPAAASPASPGPTVAAGASDAATGLQREGTNR